MRTTFRRGIRLLIFLQLVITLCSCSTTNTTPAPALVWKVDVAKLEIKDNLKAVESVTQYDGKKLEVEHQQAPGAGNIYLILKVSVSKTGADSIAFDWNALTVQDAAGNAYHRHENDSFLAQFNYTPRLTGLVIRFGVNEGWICFEIPAAAANNPLALHYSAAGSQQEISLKN
jgi:hypothetical protein